MELLRFFNENLAILPIFTIIMGMNSYINSTLFLPISSNEDSTTLKRMSSSILVGQTTDLNITMSLFEMPKEIMEQIERDFDPNNLNFSVHEHKSS